MHYPLRNTERENYLNFKIYNIYLISSGGIYVISDIIAAIKYPVRSNPLGKSVVRIEHEINGKTQSKKARKILMKDLKAGDHVKILCGEFSDNTFEFAKEVLEKGACVEIVSGNLTDTHINEIKQLLKDYPKHVRYFKLNERPIDHGMLIGENIFLEDTHEKGTKYETALVVWKAWKETIEDFNLLFNYYENQANEVTA